MSFNSNNTDLVDSIFGCIIYIYIYIKYNYYKIYIKKLVLLVIPDYILLYPAILASPVPLFNILIQIFSLILLSFLLFSIFYLSSKENYDAPSNKTYKEIWGFLSEVADKILVVPIIGLTVGNLSCEYSNS